MTREALAEKRELDYVRGNGFNNADSRRGGPSIGRKGKATVRSQTKRLAKKQYLAGAIESNKIMHVEGQPIVTKTPTTAKQIKGSHARVMGARRAAIGAND
jgi:hypothetical protein